MGQRTANARLCYSVFFQMQYGQTDDAMLFQLLERLHGYLMPFPFWVRRLGPRGEYLVRRHFHRRGYHVLARNWRHGKGELDLIMSDGRFLLFLEAKARSGMWTPPLDQVLRQDQERRLLSLARTYISLHHLDQVPWRFSLVYLCFNSPRRYTLNILEI